MSSSPGSRTSTFLMTDIAGSTRLWEEEPAAMAVALAAHDAILRDAVEQARGHRGQDDRGRACSRPSTSPRAAVEACVAGQRALLDHAWPTIVAAARPDGPPLGLAPRRATATSSARPSTASPGCWRSATAARSSSRRPVRRSSRTTCRPASTLLDRGDHRLKDLEPAGARLPARRARACRPTSRRSARARRRRTSRPADLVRRARARGGRGRRAARDEPPRLAGRRRRHRQDAPDAPGRGRRRRPASRTGRGWWSSRR